MARPVRRKHLRDPRRGQAAAKLYASQPTVSAHIRQLEEELHETLFLRTTKSLAITPRGRELYDYAVHVLDLQDDALYLPLAEKVGEARCLNNGERVKFDTLRGKGIVLNLEHVPEDTDRIIELTLR